MTPSAAATDRVIADLRQMLGDRLSTAAVVREHHARGESWHAPAPPDAVAFPVSTDEVSAILQRTSRDRIPIIAFGAGSSIEGHVNAIHGGICLDMTRMNRVLRLSVEDLDVTAEAGITRKQLDERLKTTGTMFPVDPGADATLGGMAATRASGTTAVRYGTMRENVLGLTVVLADGQVVHTGSRARKSSSGYDLTRLFVGSEGTLGVITELTLRLSGRPEALSTAICPFATMEGAVATVMTTIQLGIPVARAELLDDAQLRAVNQYARTSYREAPTLFFEFHGISDRAVGEQAEAVAEIAREHGALEFTWAATPEERARLWHARHHAYYAALASRPGSLAWTTDVCVPISALAECVLETQADLLAAGVVAPLVGHAGDGNFHLIFLIDPAQSDELAAVKALNHRLVTRAQRLDGTCSGEHGVGIGKLAYLEAEHGASLAVMRQIKRALDPHNLMNPGKLIPGAFDDGADAGRDA